MSTRPLQRLLIGIALITATAVGSAQGPIFIGLVREDGYLIPIAEVSPKLFDPPYIEMEWPFKNLEWKLYGLGKAGRPVMPAARGWPPITAAEAALRAVEIPTEIKTIEPLTAESHCSDQGVWRTTLNLPPAPRNVAPVRKIGIAIAGSMVEQPEDATTQPDADSRRVTRRIVQLAHAKEAERIASIPEPYVPAAHTPAERAKVPVRLKQLRRHVSGGVSTYYFEAYKAWGAAINRGLVTGWIVDRTSGLTGHDVKYKFNDDGFKENDQAIVWGVVAYQGKSLWILEWHSYEWEYYTLHEWPSGVERLRIDGGGC